MRLRKLPSEPIELRVGILPMPNFTMLAFAGFVDALRLAADDGDRSRQIRCRWQVISERRRPVRASNGIGVMVDADLVDPRGFDYLVVVGGTLHGGGPDAPILHDYLARAASLAVPLVGLCTGSFTLARAGLLDGRRACVSWFHHDDFMAEFPGHRAMSDRLFLDDGDRITCAGGTSVVHLASHLIERHCGADVAAKVLRIMIEEPVAGGAAAQPAPPPMVLPPSADPRVQQTLATMERRIAERLTLAELAGEVATTPRHLTRLFRKVLGMTPSEALRQLRMARAAILIEQRRARLADVAAECGFVDASHLIRVFRASYGTTPRGRAA